MWQGRWAGSHRDPYLQVTVRTSRATKAGAETRASGQVARRSSHEDELEGVLRGDRLSHWPRPEPDRHARGAKGHRRARR